MDFVSTALVTLKQPTGFWPTILNAFKGAMGSYILAVILIAVIVRLLFSLVDVINKKVNMKNSGIQAKMKPELDAIQKKYGHDQRLLQQKQNEIYKKYQFNMMGSCLPMLITLVLQFTVFLTLWNSLQSVSNYNIANKYENMKDLYANVIQLNDTENTQNLTLQDSLQALAGTDYDLSANLDIEENKLYIVLTDETGGQETFEYEYKTDFSVKDGETITKSSNQAIFELLQKYVLPKAEETTPENPEGGEPEAGTTAEEGSTETIEFVEDTGFNEIFIKLAEEAVREYYDESQEGFLWIKNIYRPESPSTPMFTKSDITKYMSNYYTSEEKELEETSKFEEKIFDCIISENGELDQIASQKNGYYILAILAVGLSVLSTWLSNKLMRDKNQPAQKPNLMMYILMPVIMGIFTLMYTSLFAIYLIVGQLMMIALTPLTTLIVKKWISHDSKKQKDKDVIEVDYRRKDI